MNKETLKRFDIYIGCNVDGKEKHTRAEVRSIVGQALTELGFSGCTFTEAIGMWQGESEQRVICTVCTDREQAIYVVAGLIKDRLQQESVMIVKSEPQITFISY